MFIEEIENEKKDLGADHKERIVESSNGKEKIKEGVKITN